MRDVDQMIDEALSAEERDLLARMGEEPGFFVQAIDLFRGKLGWIHLVLMVVQVTLFIGAVYAAWYFFAADDPVTQLRWGLPATVMALAAVVIRLSLLSTLNANRVMRALKRIELQIARGRA